MPKKLHNLYKINKFLERHKLLKLTQKEIENLNRPIPRKNIEVIINNLPTKKIPESDGFTSECYQKLKELIPIFHKLF